MFGMTVAQKARLWVYVIYVAAHCAGVINPITIYTHSEGISPTTAYEVTRSSSASQKYYRLVKLFHSGHAAEYANIRCLVRRNTSTSANAETTDWEIQ